jgi:hypothetical protein
MLIYYPSLTALMHLPPETFEGIMQTGPEKAEQIQNIWGELILGTLPVLSIFLSNENYCLLQE